MDKNVHPAGSDGKVTGGVFSRWDDLKHTGRVWRPEALHTKPKFYIQISLDFHKKILYYPKLTVAQLHIYRQTTG